MPVRIVASLAAPPTPVSPPALGVPAVPGAPPPSTETLLTTCLTPWVLSATRSASDFSAAVGAEPLKVTAPFAVSTLILAALVVGSAASLFFTAVVTVASVAVRLSQPVRAMTSAATIAMNESFIFYTPLYYSLTQRLAPIQPNREHSQCSHAGAAA